MLDGVLPDESAASAASDLHHMKNSPVWLLDVWQLGEKALGDDRTTGLISFASCRHTQAIFPHKPAKASNATGIPKITPCRLTGSRCPASARASISRDREPAHLPNHAPCGPSSPFSPLPTRQGNLVELRKRTEVSTNVEFPQRISRPKILFCGLTGYVTALTGTKAERPRMRRCRESVQAAGHNHATRSCIFRRGHVGLAKCR